MTLTLTSSFLTRLTGSLRQRVAPTLGHYPIQWAVFSLIGCLLSGSVVARNPTLSASTDPAETVNAPADSRTAGRESVLGLPVVDHPDYAGLVDLYNATNGSGWTNKTNWLSTTDPCGAGWYGVSCQGGRVTAIRLENNNLVGTLPSSLSTLTNLRTLWLFTNKLSGSLPSSWSALTNLVELELSRNQLSGPLPTSWSALTNLLEITLFANQLSGSLPDSWSALTKLVKLELRINQLSGILPTSWSALTNLQELRLNNNQLSGSLPSSWSALTNLVELDLSTNQLSGILPTSWSALTNLQGINLYINQLSGPLPNSWSALTNLVFFYLYSNQLSGCFPASYTVFCGGGRAISFANNTGLPGGGDFNDFCRRGIGQCIPLAVTLSAGSADVCVGSTVTVSANVLGGVGTPTYQWYKDATPLTGNNSATTASLSLSNVPLSAAGNYSVVVNDGSSSVTSSAFRLTVNTAPTASISPVTATLNCTTPSASLTASGGTTYRWEDKSTAAVRTVSSAGTYSVTVTGASGCTASASTTVTEDKTPPTASISGNLTVTSGGSTTLTAGGGTTQIWSTGETTPSIVVPAGVYSVTVTTNNGCSAIASATVGTLNTAPVATANANQTATVGTAFTYTVAAFTDPEAQPLIYTANIDPANGFSFDPATRIITGTPTSIGVSSIRVTASDPGSLTASTSFTITVSPAPVVVTPLTLNFTASPATILTTGTTMLSATVSGGTSPYAYRFTGPGTIAASGNTAGVSGLSAGVQTFTVTAADATTPINQTISATVSVTVSQANQAPTTSGINNQTATIGQAFSLDVASSFLDPDGDVLTYSASGLPAGLTLAGSTISGTPSMSGVSSVTVRATDPGSLSVAASFTITVSPAPVVVKPLALTFTASPTMLLTTGTTTLSASVAGGTTPYRYVFSGPGTITPSGNTGSVSGLSAGVKTFTVLVTDATSPTSQTLSGTVSVTVIQANTQPTVANPVVPQSATVGVAYTLSLASVFTDAETPNSLILKVSSLPAGLNFTAPMTISGTPSMSGVTSVMVRATDPGSLSASTSFTIMVSPAPMTNQAPVATANVNQTATVGTAFAYTVNAFTDPDGDALTYSASLSPTNGLSFNPTTRVISGTPSLSGVSNVTITATDPGSMMASTSFTLTVSPAGSTPPPPSGTFSITGVQTIRCEVLSAGQRRLTFNPQYAGLNGAPVSFSVVSELVATTSPGPYMLNLYTDNPVITLSAAQSGANTLFAYNWLSVCSSTTANTPPTVANPVSPQSATVGVGYTLSLANVFTDAETPNGLVLSVTGLPAGLNFVAPSTISGTPSMSGVSSVTVTATDPGSLSASTSFTITVNPAAGTPPPPTGTFSITSVQTIRCEVLSAGQRRLTFNPQYAGLNGAPVSFSVVNELAPTTAPGPYTLNLYTDNSVVTLRAVQSGISSSFAYNWLSACSASTANTAPTVANPVPPQSATVGVTYTLSLANVFTDAETPNQLTLTVNGLPAGLNFVAPSTISGTPSMSGVSTVTVTVTDPGSLSASTSFSLTVNPVGSTPPPTTFSITGVQTISCQVLSVGQRRLTFTPQYAGPNGTPVSFSVVNELVPTTNPGPYTLDLYTDNPVIGLRAVQSGVSASFSYGWLAACNPGARLGTGSEVPLTVTVLGNPVVGESVEVEVRGVDGQALRLQLTNERGHPVIEQWVGRAGVVERQTLRLGQVPAGVLLLRVSTSTQSQTLKLLKTE